MDKLITVYGIKDNYADTRAIYKELNTFQTWIEPRLAKHIDSYKSYHNTYYFSTEEKMSEFTKELLKRYGKQ